MRDLLSISHQNSVWEEYERRKKRESIKKCKKRILARLRLLWGPGSSDMELIRWWQSEDPRIAQWSIDA